MTRFQIFKLSNLKIKLCQEQLKEQKNRLLN